MRFVSSALILFCLTAIPSSAQPWKLDAPLEVPAPPGGTAEVEVTVTNDGSTEANGSFLQRAIWAVATGILFQSAINSDRRVACALQGIVAGNYVVTCYCDPITVPPHGKVTTKYTVGLPLSALPGTRIPIGITYQYTGGSTIGRSVSIVVGNPAAPKLEIEIIQLSSQYNAAYYTLTADYLFRVKNKGNAPTAATVPIDVDISFALPGGVEMTFRGEPPDWISAGSVVRYRTFRTLQPEESLDTPFLRLTTSPHFIRDVSRSRYEITALVAGGGSPPDEERDDFTPFDLYPRTLEVMATSDPPAAVSGRRR